MNENGPWGNVWITFCLFNNQKRRKTNASRMQLGFIRVQIVHAQITVDTILDNNQIDVFFQCIYLFHFSTCFEQPSAHHQESQLYQYIIWYMSLCVGDCLVCRSGTPGCHLYRVIHIPHDVLIQLILLMMSTGLLETCREVK
jgi:hypothetical protein